MSRQYQCPNCGAPVPFQSSVSIFAVCGSCRSMVVRKDLNVELLGQMAELPPDLSPLQVGTRGEFRGVSFMLIGRLRVAWSGGSWNEWHAVFNDGSRGWVAEAQGAFMVSFERATTSGFPEVAPGAVVELAGGRFTVTDRKITECLGGEGELPFVAAPGRRAQSIDLTAPGGEFANVEIGPEGRATVYTGRYATFDELGFSQLRPVPGWSPDAPPIDAKRGAGRLNCAQCGAPMEIRAAGQSMSAACGHCGAIVDTSRAEWQLIEKGVERTKRKPPLELGRRGALRGHPWEVIGFQHRRAAGYGWDELLLFNPWRGFLWLTHFQGHWNLVERVWDEPEMSAQGQAALDKTSFRPFARADAQTTFVLGEFYWRVRRGEKANVFDYVAPPLMLSREGHDDLKEVTWSRGTYVSPKEVAEAFGSQPTSPEGVFMNQPNPHRPKARAAAKVLPWALLALVLVQAVSCGRTRNEEALEVTFPHNAGAPNRGAFVSESFVVEPPSKALEISAFAPVSNQWLEATISVVKEDGSVLAVLGEEVEYYDGEGSRTKARKIPAVPPGVYHLSIETEAAPGVTAMPVQVKVVSDVVLWWNFLIALAAVLVYPACLWLRAGSFEKRRWAESDFSSS